MGALPKKDRVVYEGKICPKVLKTQDFICGFTWLSHFFFSFFSGSLSLKYYNYWFSVRFPTLIKNAG